MFLESILFLQKLKNFKNIVALFWRLSRGSPKSQNSAASSRVNFGDLFSSERSSHEGYTEIFTAQLVTPSRVNLLVGKTLRKFFTILFLSVLAARPGDLLATHLSRKKCVLCVSKRVFKIFLSIFPRIFVTVHCLPHFSLNYI